MAIIEAAGYEVDLTIDPPRVQKVKHRKPLGLGYSYAPGADTYRMTIKVGSANWKRAVRVAKEKSSAPTDDQVKAYIASLLAADIAAGIE